MAGMIQGVSGAVQQMNLADVTKYAETAGTGLEALGSIGAGRYQGEVADYRARAMRQEGKARFAASTYAAAEERRQSRLAQSKAQAIAAASGGGAIPETIATLEKEGELRALTALWEGQDAQDKANYAAAGMEAQGRNARTMGWLNAAGGILEAAPSLAEKYGWGVDGEDS